MGKDKLKSNNEGECHFVIYTVFKYEDELGGDYSAVYIDLNGDRIARYGDYYHDKGSDKAGAFIDGWLLANNLTLKSKNVTIKYDELVDPNAY